MTRTDIHKLLTPDPERLPRFIREDIPLFPAFPLPGAIKTNKFHIISDSVDANGSTPLKKTIIERSTKHRVIGLIVFEI